MNGDGLTVSSYNPGITCQSKEKSNRNIRLKLVENLVLITAFDQTYDDSVIALTATQS